MGWVINFSSEGRNFKYRTITKGRLLSEGRGNAAVTSNELLHLLPSSKSPGVVSPPKASALEA